MKIRNFIPVQYLNNVIIVISNNLYNVKLHELQQREIRSKIGVEEFLSEFHARKFVARKSALTGHPNETAVYPISDVLTDVNK